MAPASMLLLYELQFVDEMQAELPVTLLYLPATHWTHGPPAGPVVPLAQGSGMHSNGLVPTFSYPDLHVQLEKLVLPIGDVVCTCVLCVVQFWHTVAPVVPMYVPAGQEEQVCNVSCCETVPT